MPFFTFPRKMYRGLRQGGLEDTLKKDKDWTGFDKKPLVSPIWFTPDIEFAKLYAGSNGSVYSAIIDPKKTFPLKPIREKDGNYIVPTEYGQKLINNMLERGMFGLSLEDDYEAEQILKSIDNLDYDILETSDFISWLKSEGYDSFFIRGDGPTNLGILDKSIIKNIDKEKEAVLESKNLNSLLTYLFEFSEKKQYVTEKEAMEIGDKLRLDWKKIDLNEFVKGMNVELEHGSKLGKETNITKDDLITTGKIALAHLEEIPDYYTRLDKMEKSYKK